MSEAWQTVIEGGGESTYRLRVEGGWIYLHQTEGVSESMVFVPSEGEDDE